MLEVTGQVIQRFCMMIISLAKLQKKNPTAPFMTAVGGYRR